MTLTRLPLRAGVCFPFGYFSLHRSMSVLAAPQVTAAHHTPAPWACCFGTDVMKTCTRSKLMRLRFQGVGVTLNFLVHLLGLQRREMAFKESKQISHNSRASPGLLTGFSPITTTVLQAHLNLKPTANSALSQPCRVCSSSSALHIYRPASVHPRKTKLVTMATGKLKVPASRCESVPLAGVNKCGLGWLDSVTPREKLGQRRPLVPLLIVGDSVTQTEVCVCLSSPSQVNK